MLLEERFLRKKNTSQVLQLNMKHIKKPAHDFVRFRLNSAPKKTKIDIRPDVCPFSFFWEQIPDIFVRRFFVFKWWSLVKEEKKGRQR